MFLGGYTAPALVLNKWEEGVIKKANREGSAESGVVALKNEM